MDLVVKVCLYALLFLIPFAAIKLLNNKRNKRRNELVKKRLTPSQREELIRDFPLFGKLPQDLQGDLEGLIHVFIEEKGFEACGGLEEVTPHMQRVIAAQACLLILRRPHDMYKKLRSILVYPSAYTVIGPQGQEDIRLGESWSTGSVVLSWRNVISGGMNTEDGHHVSLHEFAHQLDQDDGVGDGVPILPACTTYKEWANTMRPAFIQHVKDAERGKRTPLDHYGAENPAEFFSVVTETFYEKPKQLKKVYPDLFDLFVKYYGVNPLEWD